MALDRTIRWHDRRPGKDDLAAILAGYFGDAASLSWDARQSRWYVTIPGKPSNPFPEDPPMRDDGRWVEVWWDPDGSGIDVMTRLADNFTNDVAAGLARRVARYYGVEVEE